ncbi:MAG: MarR family transcriptional regulator [bacterium]
MSTTDTRPTDFGLLLDSAYAAFKDTLHTSLAAAGFDDLGPSFGYVFRSLADGPLSLVQLAVRLGITPQGALKIVTEMVERGYVGRQDDTKDRRVRLLVLTTRGKAALRAARRIHAQVERDLIAELGVARVAAARAVLDSLADSAAGAPTSSRATRPF